MKARLQNPAMIVPDAMPALQTLAKVVQTVDLPPQTLGLVHLRASQLNGCAACIDGHLRYHGKQDTVERMMMVAAWRESPLFTDAERAALALAEAMTHLREDGVPDDVWNAAAKQFSEAQLGGLVLYIATTNLWNRLNVTTRQPPGGW
jgi:AhpD family alkylhydroperoxidase